MGTCPLEEVWRSSYQYPKEGNVSHVWSGILAGKDAFKEGLDRLPNAGTNGAICWRFTLSNAFSVKTAYDIASGDGQLDDDEAEWKAVWGIKGPRRQNMFLWRWSSFFGEPDAKKWLDGNLAGKLGDLG